MGRAPHSAASVRLPDFVEPMQAKLVDSMRPGDWIYEIKFDGYRALARRGGSETRILSRNQNDLGKKFTEVRDSIAAPNSRRRAWSYLSRCLISRTRASAC